MDTIFDPVLKKSSNEEQTKTLIEYEVHMSRDINDSYDFEKLEDFIKTKYDLYKDKYELHIKNICARYWKSFVTTSKCVGFIRKRREHLNFFFVVVSLRFFVVVNTSRFYDGEVFNSK